MFICMYTSIYCTKVIPVRDFKSVGKYITIINFSFSLSPPLSLFVCVCVCVCVCPRYIIREVMQVYCWLDGECSQQSVSVTSDICSINKHISPRSMTIFSRIQMEYVMLVTIGSYGLMVTTVK